MLFAGVYDRLNHERRDVVTGLDRFGRRQKDHGRDSAQGDARRCATCRIKAARTPKLIKKPSEAVAMASAPFRRAAAQALAYVCESPR